jgi:copper resistance protein D
MIEWISQFARWLHLISGAYLLGGCWWLSQAAPLPGERQHIVRTLRWAVLIFIVSGLLLLACQTALADGANALALRLEDIARFALRTRFGNVWLCRIGGALLLLGYLRLVARPSWPMALIASAILQASLALAGHGAASDAALLAQSGHAAHLLAASLWLGGLMVLLNTIRQTTLASEISTAADAMRRFSDLAMVCMITTIMSGTIVAALQIRSWPGLFGTGYGQQLLLKLALLGGALAIAGHLRWHALKNIDAQLADARARRPIVAWLGVELAFAIAVMWCAAALAQSAPAQHQQIVWPFAFRVAPQVTWKNADLQTQFYWGLAIIAAGCAWLVWTWRSFGANRRDALIGCGIGGLGMWLAGATLSVPAFPDTYRRSNVPFQAISIAGGEQLYRERCIDCHGSDVTGNGPLAKSLPKPPADLTAPHSGDHTPGDRYWWLSNGIAASAMPAFADLSEEQRWDLVNYLHLLSVGYQARVIRERVVALRPWLAAPDFNYAASDSSSGSLKDFREQAAVLLVFYGNDSTTRLAQLAQLQPQLQKLNVHILAIPAMQAIKDIPQTAIPIVCDGADEIALSYQLLRRTIENPRNGEQAPHPTHMEFLIDRYGYLRARWLPEDSEPGWRDERLLLEQAALLFREPKVKLPPDEHLH